MRKKTTNDGVSITTTLQLTPSEIKILKEAQAIAERIREYVGEQDYDNDTNLDAARVEHGITALLEQKIILKYQWTNIHLMRLGQ